MKTLILLASVLIFTGCIETRRDMERSELQQELQKKLTNLQQSRASNEAQMEELNSQFREVFGRLEVMEKKVEDKVEQEATTEVDEQLQVKELAKNFALYREALDIMEKKIEDLESKVDQLSAQKGKSSSKKKGNYSLAEEAFQAKNWKSAIVNYQKYRDRNPKGRRYGLVTYKMGVCFQELGMKSEAKSFFEEVVEKFPKSSEAKKAKYRLSRLKS